MRPILLVLTAVSALWLSGCATAPPVQPPLLVANPVPQFALSRAAALGQTNHMTKHLDEQKNILYFQNFGGGGAVAGLLLGPIGVAANIKLIDSATKQDVQSLSGKIAIDPRASLVSATKRTGTTMSEAAADGMLGATPYLYVVKANPETLVLAAALIVEVPGEKTVLPRKYMYQLPGTYSVAALGELNETATLRISEELEAGYVAILRMIARDTPEAAAQEQSVRFKSEFLVPRFNFELTGNLIGQQEADVVWVRIPGGVYAVRPEFFQRIDATQASAVKKKGS